MTIVEVGIKLDKDFVYYDNLLKQNGLINDFQVTTHDIYYTNKNLDGLSENEMKNSCIRIRSYNDSNYIVQNNLLRDLTIKEILKSELYIFENKLNILGYKKVFDTSKKDYHYFKDGMKSKVQLQEIDDVGLLVYFDNKQYYNYDINTLRNLLIEELNSYGFRFEIDVLGLDKLRTLYYKKEMFSENQNE